MTIRLLEPDYYTGTLHTDVLPITFANLDLANLLMAERVCKTWHKASISHNELWEQVAYRKGIFIDRSLPIRAQVIQSFGPYCEAARKIFIKELKYIPINSYPIIEKQMIDKSISEIDKALIDPMTALSDSLKINGFSFYPTQVGIQVINDCIAMIPVFVETGKLTINEDIFHHLMEKEGQLSKYSKDLTFCFSIVKDCIISLFIEGERPNLLNFSVSMSEIFVLQKAIFSFAEYILHFTAKPSLEIVAELCFISAGSQLRRAWHQIGLIRYQKRDILSPLLENLKDAEWDHTFAQFMLNEGVNVNVDIHYPPFIQKILEQMDKMEVQDLIDSIPLPHDTNNVYINYMHKQRQKDLQRSFQAS